MYVLQNGDLILNIPVKLSKRNKNVRSWGFSWTNRHDYSSIKYKMKLKLFIRKQKYTYNSKFQPHNVN